MNAQDKVDDNDPIQQKLESLQKNLNKRFDPRQVGSDSDDPDNLEGQTEHKIKQRLNDILANGMIDVPRK